MKKQNGITLITLVITIIVLLILAGVSISLVVGDNGILTQATTAVRKNREAVAIEDVSIAWTAAQSGYLKELTKNTSFDKETYIKEKLVEYLNKTGTATINLYDEENGIELTYKVNGDNKPYNLRISETGKVEIKEDSNGSSENEGSTGNTGSAELNPTKIIPEGGTFSRFNEELGEPEIWTENEFPEQLQSNDTYVYDNLIYEYLEQNDGEYGWHVWMYNTSAETCGQVLETIAGEPIVNMYETFYGCENLKTLPEGFKIPDTVDNVCGLFKECTSFESLPEGFVIPDHIDDMTEMFMGCTSLKSLPANFVIPENIKYMMSAFAGCTSLTDNIRINANPEIFDYCFDGVNPENIEITGDCSQETKAALLETAVVYE